MSDSRPSQQINGGSNGGAARAVPLAPAQQAALLPERMRRVSATNLFLAVESTTGFVAEELSRAATALVQRHEILRTVYPDDRRVPYQKTLPAPQVVVESTVLESEDELTAALRVDARHGFDLAHESPLRVRHYALPKRGVLSVTVHPVAADDSGLDLIVGELLGSVQAEQRPYRNFAMAQLKSLTAVDADLEFWQTTLRDLPARAALVGASSAGEPWQRREFRVALPDAVDWTAVFGAMVARTVRDVGFGDDVVIGVPDRKHAVPEIGAAIGNYANYLALRLAPGGDRTARGLVAEAAEVIVAARTHAATRIERLTYELGGAAAALAGLLFQVVVRVRPAFEFETSVAELDRVGARPHGVDLVVDVVPDGAEARVTVESVWGAAELEVFVALLVKSLTQWQRDPDAPLVDADVTPLFVPAPLFTGETGLGGPPQTEEERALAEAIRAVLELDEDDEIGRADTFFSLGGDSIAALRLVALLAEADFGVDVQQVFEFPAIQDLAAQLARIGDQRPEAAAPEVAPMGASGLDAATLAALGKSFSTR